MNKLEKHLIKIDTDLGGSPSVHPTVKDKLDEYLYIIESQAGGDPERVPDEVKDKLDWHLRRIEELLENGGGGSGKISFLIVDKLPETGEEGIVYLVPKKTIFAKNKYDEYVWIKDESDFEYIGTGAFDPTGYATIEYVDTELLKKQNNLEFNVEVPSGQGITITSIKDGDNYYVIPSSGSTVDWTDIANKPEFAEVSFSGDYADLYNKPELFSGSYNDLTDKPDLFSGSYNDLTDKPDLSIYAQSADLAAVATSGSYSDLSNKPDLFEVPVFELEEFDPEEGIMELSQTDLADIYANKYELVYLHLNYEDEEEHFSYEFNLLFKLASAITVNNDLLLQYDFYSVDDEKEEDRAVLDHISFKLGYDNEDHEYKTEVMEIYIDPQPTITWDSVTNKPEFAAVATSGSYTDLNNTPTNVSTFTNDAGYITESYHDNSKQDTLVSSTNIKTINGESLLGSGNLDKRTITLLVDQETGNVTMSQDDIDYLYTYRPSDVYVITPIAEGVTATQVYELIGSTVVADYNIDSLVYKTLGTSDSEFVTSTVVAIPHNASDPVVPVEQELALHSDIPTNISDLNNDLGFITGITSSDITTALGYTPGTSNFSGNYTDLSNTPLSSISVSQSTTPGSASHAASATTTITLDGTSTTIDTFTVIDTALSSSSKNPVANNVIFNAISNKIDAEDFQELESIALTTRGIRTGEGLSPILSINDGNYYPTVSDNNNRWKMGKADSPTFYKIYDVSHYNSVHLKSVSRAGHILTNSSPSDFNEKIHWDPTQSGKATWYEYPEESGVQPGTNSEQANVLPKTGFTPYDKDITTNGKHYLIVYEVNAAQAIEVTNGGGYSPITTSMFVNNGDGVTQNDPYAKISDIPTTPDFTASNLNLSTGAITLSQDDLEDIFTNKYDLINIHYELLPGLEMTFLYKRTGNTDLSSPPMVRYDYTSTEKDQNTNEVRMFQLGFWIYHNSGSTPEYTTEGISVKLGNDWSDITNKPSFATVATSGNYDDLTNKPTIVSDVQTTGGTSIVSSGIATIPALYQHAIHMTIGTGDGSQVFFTLVTPTAEAFTASSIISYLNSNFAQSARIAASGIIYVSANHRFAACVAPGENSTEMRIWGALSTGGLSNSARVITASDITMNDCAVRIL